jgi:hypothetical protein
VKVFSTLNYFSSYCDNTVVAVEVKGVVTVI